MSSLISQLLCRVLTTKNHQIRLKALVLLITVVVFVIIFNVSSIDQVTPVISCQIGNNGLHPKNCNHGGWKYKPLEDWTVDQIMDYAQWTNSTSCIESYNFGGFVVFNIGVTGHKAVCLDAHIGPEKTSGGWPVSVKNTSAECLVYSFGINSEWSFDEAMQNFGCRVYSFDPSMNMTNHNHSQKVHFYNLGLGDRDEIWPRKTPEDNDWKMMTLDSIYYKMLHHENRIIDYLKIDIEGDEWKVLPQIMSSGMLNRVRQLGLEIHLILEEETTLDVIRHRIKLIKTLEDAYGFVRFDSKFSPWSRNWKVIDGNDWIGYNSYEMAWYNSRLSRTSDAVDSIIWNSPLR